MFHQITSAADRLSVGNTISTMHYGGSDWTMILCTTSMHYDIMTVTGLTHYSIDDSDSTDTPKNTTYLWCPLEQNENEAC